MDEAWRLAAKADALRLRTAMIGAVRRFFEGKDFLEVETPVRIPAPAPEPHIDAFPSGDWYLQTSPELCMKRLLAAGYPKIFQICKSFRAGERGDRHLPEFTLLEWYRAAADYRVLMKDCEEMLLWVTSALGFQGGLSWQGQAIALAGPWERLTVQEAFARYAPISLTEALEQDRFDEILTAAIEPRLGERKPVFLCDYPAALGALARLKPEDPCVAERFELYIGGMEMANAFSELTDAREQRQRFELTCRERSSRGSEVYPLPEPFLAALSGMPPAAGIAFGLDRLAMLLAGASRIDEIVTFTPEIL